VNVAGIVDDFLEPLANTARLRILLSLSEGKKSFSKMAQAMDLKGGHLIFHLKKLLDAQLVAQEDNNGDYLITAKGLDAVKKIVSLQETLQ
jgi:predicted transcriptional regulator